ncbi:hypothetical protein PDJAM_G00258660 [Pangasius djambal]|uniref:Uncharacterized protein n=1 Tax=Pangasius djambal TaxID=1691987 RepID=A0ACC5YL48_9TELE|nr:hypothetical protein [Pangasius djambal]
MKDFTAAQLMNATFITEWFQMRLRPFLSSVSTDFLSSLSSKTFSCESYQIVVEALSSQESLMKEEQKHLVFTSFIFPFLSRVDLPDLIPEQGKEEEDSSSSSEDEEVVM